MKTKQQLKDFEDRIAAAWANGEIKAPVHLVEGNEDQLIKIFQDVRSEDWIFSTWRSHYHVLLKGVPEEEVEAEIRAGRSISLCFPEYRVYSSAIVGGILPIAMGRALQIKREGGTERVWCFIGDATSESGIAYEVMKYSRNHQLPIKFVIEDNGKYISSDTLQAWNMQQHTHQDLNDEYVLHYRYSSAFPHNNVVKK